MSRTPSSRSRSRSPAEEEEDSVRLPSPPATADAPSQQQEQGQAQLERPPRGERRGRRTPSPARHRASSGDAAAATNERGEVSIFVTVRDSKRALRHLFTPASLRALLTATVARQLGEEVAAGAVLREVRLRSRCAFAEVPNNTIATLLMEQLHGTAIPGHEGRFVVQYGSRPYREAPPESERELEKREPNGQPEKVIELFIGLGPRGGAIPTGAITAKVREATKQILAELPPLAAPEEKKEEEKEPVAEGEGEEAAPVAPVAPVVPLKQPEIHFHLRRTNNQFGFLTIFRAEISPTVLRRIAFGTIATRLRELLDKQVVGDPASAVTLCVEPGVSPAKRSRSGRDRSRDRSRDRDRDYRRGGRDRGDDRGRGRELDRDRRDRRDRRERDRRPRGGRGRRDRGGRRGDDYSDDYSDSYSYSEERDRKRRRRHSRSRSRSTGRDGGARRRRSRSYSYSRSRSATPPRRR